MNKFTYFGTAKSGSLDIPAAVRDEMKLQLLSWEGSAVEITIEKFYDNRSNRQNKYYFGVVVQAQIACMRERFGEIVGVAAMHTFNKSNFFCKEIVDHGTGSVFKLPGSSRNLTTFEFEECLEKIRQFFHSEFDWSIPLPNEE